MIWGRARAGAEGDTGATNQSAMNQSATNQNVRAATDTDAARAGGVPGHVITLRVMTYNILNGGEGRLDALAAVIADTAPDLVGLQEVRQPEALDWLATRLGMYAALARSPISGDHVGVLSRWPLTVVAHEAPPPLLKTLLEACVAIPGGPTLRFFSVHLAAQYANLRAGEGRRVREIRYALARMRQALDAGEPHLLVGDFNSLAPGEPLRASRILTETLSRSEEEARQKRLPGVHNVVPAPLRPLVNPLALGLRLPPVAALFDALVGSYVPRRVIRMLRRAGYVDCFAAQHPGPKEWAASCPTAAPAGRIDYIFASPDLAPRLRACEIVREAPARPVAAASDHYPVLAEFQFAMAADSLSHEGR